MSGQRAERGGGLGTHDAAALGRDELVARFTGREALLGRLLATLRASEPGEPPQHHLLSGPWGCGKSAMLRRLEIAVASDGELAARYEPLRFVPAPYAVRTLEEFWCGWAGGIELERLTALARERGKTFVLLLDDADLVLARLADEHWALRETLSQVPELLLVAAERSRHGAAPRYAEAFFDFFRMHRLAGLAPDESAEVLRRLATWRADLTVAKALSEHPRRVSALHGLLGGNPRLLVMLYQVLLEGDDLDACALLGRVLERLETRYRTRLEALPELAQVVLCALAAAWHPSPARGLAQSLSMEPNKVSTYLDRLSRQGLVRKVPYPPGRKTGFLVADRLFNAWYLLRWGGAERDELLGVLEFLERGGGLPTALREAQGDADSADSVGPAGLERLAPELRACHTR